MSRSNQLAGLLTADPPSALDTINEINTALGNDNDLSGTLTGLINAKASKSGDTFTGNVGIGGSPDELLHLKSATSLKPILKIENTNADHLNAQINFIKNSASEADDDFLGQIDFEGLNDNDEMIVYGRLQSQAKDVSDGTEDGRVYIASRANGTLDQTFNVVSGKVGIGEQSPDTTLHIAGDFDGSGSNAGTAPNKGITISKRSGNYASGEPYGIVCTDHTGDFPVAGVMAKSTEVSTYVGGQLILQTKTKTDATLQDRVTITKDGNVEVNTGNLVIGTAGKGIDFSNASGSNSGANSSVLDDYEEGDIQHTSFPTSGGGNVPIYTNPAYNSIRYVKVGNVCTVHGGIIFGGSLSGTDGNLQIPLPFNVVTGPQLAGRSVGSLIYEGIAIYVIRCDDGASFAKVEGTGGVDTYIQGSTFNTGHRIIFSLTYTTV